MRKRAAFFLIPEAWIPLNVKGCRLDINGRKQWVIEYSRKSNPPFSRSRTYAGAWVTDATATDEIKKEQRRLLQVCLRWVWRWHRYGGGENSCPMHLDPPEPGEDFGT